MYSEKFGQRIKNKASKGRHWFMNILFVHCSASGYTNLLVFVSNYRSALNDVETYGHIQVPLVYSQVGILYIRGGHSKLKPIDLRVGKKLIR